MIDYTDQALADVAGDDADEWFDGNGAGKAARERAWALFGRTPPPRRSRRKGTGIGVGAVRAKARVAWLLGGDRSTPCPK